MLVGMGDDPSIGEYERLLLSTKTTARKELVLLHPERTVVPGSTREWLKVFWALFSPNGPISYNRVFRFDRGYILISM
jgi:hypothetical protein